MEACLDQRTAVRSAQLRQLFSESRIALITGTLLAALLAYVQQGLIAAAVIRAWFSLMAVIAPARAMLARRYRENFVESESALRAWLWRFRAGVLAAGGAAALSADLFSAVAFSLPVLAPIIARLPLTPDRLSAAMAAAGLLYLGFILLSLRRFNGNITQNIVLRLNAVAREEVLRISEERCRILLSRSPVGIFQYDKALTITYCNERFTEIFNCAGNGAATLHDLRDPSILTPPAEALNGKAVTYEGRYAASAKSREVWLEMSCAPWHDRGHDIIDGIAAVKDISERKGAEEQLSISAIAFESQAAMIVTDAGGVIPRANCAFGRLTGYGVQEVIGRTPNFLSSGRHTPAFFKAMWETLQKTGQRQGEIWNKRKSGLIFAEWLIINAVAAPDGRVSHYVGAYSDITENKDALAEIHRLAYYDPLTQLPNRRTAISRRLCRGRCVCGSANRGPPRRRLYSRL